MKIKTYYIVESRWEGDPEFRAFRWVFFGIFVGYVSGTVSFNGPDVCEERLRKVVVAKGFKPKVVRVVKV